MQKWIDLNKHIEYILDQFDFEAVKKTMTALGWTWNDNPEPPSYNELRRVAKEMLENAVRDNSSWSTGGFEAVKDGNLIVLSFVVTAESNEDIL